MKTNKRILFCVETTRRADTDYGYIQDTIRHYYEESSKIVTRPVYMESKSRYNSRSVQEDIKKQSGMADTVVIYCIDTDEYDVSDNDRQLLEQIRNYCRKKGYEFVFFCKDVEDVFCGHSVPKTQKGQAIRKFRTSKSIEKIDENSLRRDEYQVHCSNILNVMDRYWKRKKE